MQLLRTVSLVQVLYCVWMDVLPMIPCTHFFYIAVHTECTFLSRPDAPRTSLYCWTHCTFLSRPDTPLTFLHCCTYCIYLPLKARYTSHFSTLLYILYIPSSQGQIHLWLLYFAVHTVYTFLSRPDTPLTFLHCCTYCIYLPLKAIYTSHFSILLYTLYFLSRPYTPRTSLHCCTYCIYLPLKARYTSHFSILLYTLYLPLKTSHSSHVSSHHSVWSSHCRHLLESFEILVVTRSPVIARQTGTYF